MDNPIFDEISKIASNQGKLDAEEIFDVAAVKPYVLHKTKSYHLFASSEQRNIDWEHVNRLASEMDKNGFLPSQHIDVQKKEGKFLIIDGHHRYHAAEKRKFDLYFMYAPELSSDMIPNINSTQKSWKAEDYLNYFANKKHLGPYIELRDYIKQFGFGLSVGISFALGGTGAQTDAERIRFQTGRFEFEFTEKAYGIGYWSQDFKPYFKAYKEKSFVIALQRLWELEGYSHEEMVKKVSQNSARLTKQSEFRTYLAILEDIYNYKRHGKRFKFTS